ncbi:MAG: alcohol dehydrogenase catalytic domain-containing protein [Propionibacteriaceae bacterium]|jgi:threonine dehydrogenase-like Zn-dependent dehydrogenase|nr:alcohol dehydrogenase catalytic domain-containing protein [Propionibacteriaceae bacterium]
MPMKGYILQAVGVAEWRDDLPIPEPELGEILIKPVVVAPCTSDVHIIETMAFSTLQGRPLGHEVAGVVAAVGPGVRHFQEGDRVAVPSAIVNWANPMIQEGYDKYDQLSSYFLTDPRLGGCFAEYFLIKDGDMNVARIPDEVTWEQAVVCTDMGTTGFEAVNWLHLKYGQSVVVYGIGAVGLMAICAAVLKGVGRIFGVGSRQVCFDVARQYGATDLVNYRDGDVSDQIMALNGGPVDTAVVCGGADISALAEAVQMVRQGGYITNAAAFMHDTEFVLPNAAWMYGTGDRTIRGIGTRGGRAFLERLLTLAKYGRFQPERIVTHTFHGMEHLPQALAMMGGQVRDAIKPVVFFD